MAGINRVLGPLSPTVKIIIIVNVALFGLCALLPSVFDWLALIPAAVYPGLQLWRLVSYMFLHANISHILVNMVVLWSFGGPLERVWGKNKFLFYYFLCGVGSGLVCVPFYALAGQSHVAIVGASGAVMALLLAHAFLFPNSIVLFMMIIPVKIRTLIYFIIAIEWFSVMSYMGGDTASKVASIAHLAGMAIGYFHLRRLMDLRALIGRVKSRGKRRAYRVIDGGDDQRRGPWLH
jgi:membrane associated rhomboid family serine protease